MLRQKINRLLNGDGLLDDIFPLLWTKPQDDTISFNFRLPNTIIFRDRKPTYWFFSNKQGVILKKKIQSLNTELLIQAFGFRPNQKCDIIASYLYTHNQDCTSFTVPSFTKRARRLAAPQLSQTSPCSRHLSVRGTWLVRIRSTLV